MGTIEVTEYLRHNENLYDQLLERKTLTDTGCNHFVQTFQFYVHTFYVETRGHGSECSSNERPKLERVKPTTFGSLNDYFWHFERLLSAV